MIAPATNAIFPSMTANAVDVIPSMPAIAPKPAIKPGIILIRIMSGPTTSIKPAANAIRMPISALEFSDSPLNIDTKVVKKSVTKRMAGTSA
ncbi:hypothetical protein [Shouchella clausii]|uniref:hypothetical protein n=1 Tax=Shouchella clausii TaxID=79880 RepID=UPI001FEBB38A|nr:hypothetical protein [Shouchella clausii]